MKSALLSCVALCFLFASPVYAQTASPCAIAEKVTTYPNGEKKVGLRCPVSTPGTKGDAVSMAARALPQTWTPLTSAMLTDALAKATGGDTIVLAAGVTYPGAFQLPVHAGTEYVTIRTSATLPEQRVTDSPTLPTLVSTVAGVSTLTTAPGAHHWRVIGVRFTQTGGNTYGIIRCGSADGYTDLAHVPHHIEFDRVVVTVPESMEERRGLMAHCDDLTIRRSVIGGMHETGADSQAIGGWDGASRIHILDNDLMAAGETILFGGAVSSPLTPVPQDIEVRNNHIWRPTSWTGKPWNIKNLFELKNARRVVITDNLLENNPPGAQTGWSILFTARGEATAPWMVVEDVTFERNVVKNVAAGINILGFDDYSKTTIARKIRIANNLILTNKNLGGPGAGDGKCFMLLGSPNDVTIDHNTCINDGSGVLTVDMGGRPPATGFRYTNNLALHQSYGIIGTGEAPGLPTILRFFWEGGVVQQSVFAGCNGTPYPATNLCPTVAFFTDQFVDPTTGNYALKATSVWKGAGTDGKDLGATLP